MLVRDRRFGSDSPIRDYWLTRCEGFTVRAGRKRLGVVAEVDCGISSLHAETLVVRRRRRATLLLPAERIVEVVPAQELLVARRRPSRTRPAATAVARGSTITARATARAGRTTVVAGRTAAAFAAPRVATAAHTATVVAATVARRLRRDIGLLARWAAHQVVTWTKDIHERTDGRPVHYAVARFSRRTG
jgi:hypothetical protein